MNAVKLLTIAYAMGVVLFACALVIIGVNFAAGTRIDPGIPLITGFVLMFGSKIVMRMVRRKAGTD